MSIEFDMPPVMCQRDPRFNCTEECPLYYQSSAATHYGADWVGKDVEEYMQDIRGLDPITMAEIRSFTNLLSEYDSDLGLCSHSNELDPGIGFDH